MLAQAAATHASELVLSVAGQDRPGLIQVLSQVISDHQGSWIDSSMARLGGEFAGILHITVPGDQLGAIEEALGQLGAQGINVSIRRGVGPMVPSENRARLELAGIDHPGIIHEISTALARHKVSIDELHTQVFAGSMSGDRHFVAKAIISLPQGLSAQELSQELEEIASDMLVEIDFRDADNA